MIITLSNQKGGSGKTTLSIALYFAFLRSDVSTLLIDTDPQQSILMLSRQLKEPLNVINEIDDEKMTEHTLTIIDTAPDYLEAKQAIEMGDIIVMPFKPSQFDVFSTIETASTINKDYPNKPVYAVLNCNVSNTSYPTETVDILNQNGVNVLNSKVGNRLDFARTYQFDGNIYKSKNTKAKSDIDALAMELYGKMIK